MSEDNLITILEAVKSVQTVLQNQIDLAEKKKLSEEKFFAQNHNSMQNKLDKIIRQLDALAEEQKKANKTILNLQKQVTTLAAKVNVAPEQNGKDEHHAPDASVIRSLAAPVTPSVANPDETESSWANNLLLIGDFHWQRMTEVEDIKRDIDAIDGDNNFIISPKKNLISMLFDATRNRIRIAVPDKTMKVAISIGSLDLLDEKLITLEKASLEDVRKTNKPILTPKSEMLFQICHQLINQGKTVVLVFPPYGWIKRTEILDQWVEMVLERCQELPKTKFKTVILPQVMKSTLNTFDSLSEYQKTWLLEGDTKIDSRNVLSDYGCRRLFDLLQKALTREVLKPKDLKASTANGICVRCLRHHPGGESVCKSKDKACRKCSKVGHFAGVHDVEDEDLQIAVKEVLGNDFFGDQNVLSGGQNARKRELTGANMIPMGIAPQKKERRIKYNSWYS